MAIKFWIMGYNGTYDRWERLEDWIEHDDRPLVPEHDTEESAKQECEWVTNNWSLGNFKLTGVSVDYLDEPSPYLIFTEGVWFEEAGN